MSQNGKKNTMTISVTDRHAQREEDKAFWRAKTPKERLDMVEILRLEAGKFLYEYPARLQRVIEVIRKT